MTAAEAETQADIAPDIEDVMALSPLQEGLYSLNRVSRIHRRGTRRRSVCDRNGGRHLRRSRRCLAARLRGENVDRHPNLRASFFSRGIARPVQIVPSRVELPWRRSPPPNRNIEALEADERRCPFDLERYRRSGFCSSNCPDARWRLVITAHHIVIDGWSLPVFVTEMMILYRAAATRYAAGCATAVPGLHRLACGPRSGSQPTGLA